MLGFRCLLSPLNAQLDAPQKMSVWIVCAFPRVVFSMRVLCVWFLRVTFGLLVLLVKFLCVALAHIAGRGPCTCTIWESPPRQHMIRWPISGAFCNQKLFQF